MSVDRAEVLRIAALAKLELDDHDVETLTADLNAILEHVDALAELEDDPPGDSEGRDAPRSTRSGEETSGRPGSVDPAMIAPAWRDGFFLVPHPPGVQADGDGA